MQSLSINNHHNNLAEKWTNRVRVYSSVRKEREKRVTKEVDTSYVPSHGVVILVAATKSHSTSTQTHVNS